MFKQFEYSEILFKNLLWKLNRCTHDEGSTYNDFFPAETSGNVSDEQKVAIFVSTPKNTFSNQ